MAATPRNDRSTSANARGTTPTSAAINDHLPEDMVDAEQIESIIGMITGMGIQVHDGRPDAEQLLIVRRQPGGGGRPPPRKQPPRRPWIPNSLAAPPTRCACICAKWGRSSC